MALPAPPATLAADAPGGARWWPLGATMVALCAGIAALSFVTRDVAHNDFERFGDLRLLFAFFVPVAGWCGAYVAAYIRRAPVPAGVLAITCFACAGWLLLSFPVGSKDVVDYSFLGKIWVVHHANPYVVAPAAFKGDPWFPSLSGTLVRPLSVYGPLFLWQSWPVSAVAGQSLLLAIWLHKAVATLLLLATLWLARAFFAGAGTEAPRSWLLLLLAWNPLLLFEAAGSAHNDVAMLLLLVAAAVAWQRRRLGSAYGLLALSFWYKWYSLIFLPVFLLESLKAAGTRAAVRHACLFAGVAAVCGAVLLAPFPGALTSITSQFLHPDKLRGIFPNELSPPLAALFWSLRAAGLFAGDGGFALFNGIRLTLFGAAFAAILIRQWRAQASAVTLAEGCCLVGLAFFLLMVTQLWPWHLLSVVGLAVLCAREPYLLIAVVSSVLGMLSYFLTFAVATVLLIAVASALWLLRRVRPTAAA